MMCNRVGGGRSSMQAAHCISQLMGLLIVDSGWVVCLVVQ
jgi:hypothetical protein